MCPTNPQKDLKSRKGNEPFSGTASEMEFLGSIGAKNPQAQRSSSGVVLNRLALRPKDGPQTSKPEGWSSSGSAPRRETMPAIASLEDLKAAQKEGVSIYAMR
jgi:hypothetical protein